MAGGVCQWRRCTGGTAASHQEAPNGGPDDGGMAQPLQKACVSLVSGELPQ